MCNTYCFSTAAVVTRTPLYVTSYGQCLYCFADIFHLPVTVVLVPVYEQYERLNYLADSQEIQ